MAASGVVGILVLTVGLRNVTAVNRVRGTRNCMKSHSASFVCSSSHYRIRQSLFVCVESLGKKYRIL